MLSALTTLDRILRGELTAPATLAAERFRLPLRGITFVLLALGALHGLCMGVFALTHPDAAGIHQTLASTLKVPALFGLTLLATFPSLYVFNALVGSRLYLLPLLRLLLASLAVTLAVLASFGPIVAFFSLSTSNYAFVVLLNVATFALANLLGIKFLRETLQRLTALSDPPPPAPPAPAGVALGTLGTLGALDPTPPSSLLQGQVRTVFRLWLVLFALVGGQMSWVLRPFIGAPGQAFSWFRPRESNFFESVWRTLQALLS